ncbi:MAG: 2,3,4,5-tetrahydropyridine-2,6-dicarboxylate N-acetyltransferase [Candidatus Delongbacteria bacterium]|nr:2,3,4,5-tetrahydropyridine-2,6-dicarboxylate N-acetyltransferase [Candidatus Delongbacteria bacterium]MBN2835904.1 2,3,4,5-tetrahydropyridine-2,6-dicarboxylate N-acetyltransferase [Candidatus Delongbacteria bacterium]
MNTQDLIDYISNSKKKTPVEVYIKGDLANIDFNSMSFFGNDDFGILIGEWEIVKSFLDDYKDRIVEKYIKNDRRNSAIPMLDLKEINARIEPGAIIRETAKIGNNCVIMMGAVINLGAEIGDSTMIDMNVVVGGRVLVGKNCHIGAGSVLAGVIEPPSATPVIIEDNVMMGANVVVLEGVRVGKGAVVAAGAVVVSDVPAGKVVAGIPAKIIKDRDEKTNSKSILVDSLRNLNK